MSTTDAFDKTRREVADKVRKLLTQAEDPAATPEEAQAFTMKAQALMTKYSIALAMITDAARADQLVEKAWTVEGPYAGHKVHLINAVARANDCRTVYADLSGGRKHIQVVGFASDVDWVQTLSRSLEIQLATTLAEAARAKPPDVHGRTFAVGFVQGFTVEVADRLHRARQQGVREAESDGGADPGQPSPAAGSVALVLVAKRHRVDDEFKVRHPSTRTVYSQVRLQSWSGYAPGRAAGRRASLARGSLGGTRGRLRS